ncbi:MAG: 50S ribosomal protein L22 [candidate division WOR-3 bacterium]|nr:50S ribosomal protein L22 [candidate division WOR-3 bacterium]
MMARAVKRYERASPLKVRKILKEIKGKTIPEARAILNFYHSRTRIPVLKTLNSAVANLKYKVGSVRVDDQNLFVKEAVANDGPRYKRLRPGFRGRPAIIKRPTCHIKIIVESLTPLQAKKGA